MTSFLITFKPASENPERGMPLQQLQRLARRHANGESVEEKWRFSNRSRVALGDRIFLLLQGRHGPAIIGYGDVIGKPETDGGKWVVPVRFESIVDPAREALALKDELFAIDAGERFWRAQSSGVRLSEGVASELEELVVGTQPTPISDSASNPDWTRDELIVALDVYLRSRPNPPGKRSKEITELSEILNRLGARLFLAESRSATFRNENGVYMKLMNFRRLDPEYTARGKVGLSRGAKAEEEIWSEFAGDPAKCKEVAEAIVATLNEPDEDSNWDRLYVDEGLQEAPEGRLLTRQHVARERSRKLVEAKRRWAMKQYGKLACEVCDFEYAKYYGEWGEGFIECHHTKPIYTLAPGHKTHIHDLALVCSNCHRMIHRRKPWPSILELKARVNPPPATAKT